METLDVTDDVFVVAVEGVPVLAVDNRRADRQYYVGQKMIEFLEALTDADMVLLWEAKRDYPPLGWKIGRGT